MRKPRTGRRSRFKVAVPNLILGNGNRKGNGTGTHTFEVTKGWCTPARAYIQQAFKPLGIRANYSGITVNYEEVKDVDGELKTVPAGQSQLVTVNNSQASWAEYVLGAVCGQSDVDVISGIMDHRNFENGKKRKGVPMPWLYQALGEVPEEGVKGCMKKLPKGEREWMEKDPNVQAALKKNNPWRGTMRFTSEGKKNRGSTGRKKGKTGKTSTKGGKRRGGRSTASTKSKKRGSHRGSHRR